MSGSAEPKPVTIGPLDNPIDATKRCLDVFQKIDSELRNAWRDGNNKLLSTPTKANDTPKGPLKTVIAQLDPGTRVAGPKYINAEGKVDPFLAAADDYFKEVSGPSANIPEKYGKFYDAIDAAEKRRMAPGASGDPSKKDLDDMVGLIGRAFEMRSRLENLNPMASSPGASPVIPGYYPVLSPNPVPPELNLFQSAIENNLINNYAALKVGRYGSSSESEYRGHFNDVLDRSRWNGSNWGTFKEAVRNLYDNIQNVLLAANQKYERERAGRPDPIGRDKATFATFVELSKKDAADLPEGLTSDMMLTTEELRVVSTGGPLTLGGLQKAFQASLQDLCSDSKALVRKWLDNPEKKASTSQLIIKELENLLGIVIMDLPGSITTAGLNSSFGLTVSRLNSARSELLENRNNSEKVIQSEASPEVAVQAAKEGLPASMGFLFRRISAERVTKYEDTIRKFQDVAASLPVKERVLTQKKRMEEACDRFAKEIENVNKTADGITASGTDVAVVSLKLNNAKADAVKSFARGVRGNVRSYLAVHETFVTRQHGEGLKYMQYWKDIYDRDEQERDPKKKIVNDKVIVELLISHAEKRGQLAADLINVLVKDSSAVLQEIEKARVAAMTKPPNLDERHQTIVDREFDNLRAWVVAQTEQSQELYLRGSPTLLESITDTTVIGVYVLKAIRMGIAWVSLRVASRTFQAWYSRAVYEQNGSPPNPAFFVALFLGLDAALHAIVLTILYGIMSLYSGQDNDFPIDSNLMSAWALDYAVVTVAVGVISLILAAVVQSKKYFAYKYMGDRGIRALQEMCLATYAVILFLPFYRLAYT